MEKIGFATEFYTLWNYRVEISRTEYGMETERHCYFYQKNISTDLEKVKALYPGVEIDEDLRGKSSSWERAIETDLNPEILKFSKYIGKAVSEVAEIDFNYCLWLIDNARTLATRNAVANVPKVAAYLAKKEADQKAFWDSCPRIEGSGEVELLFTSNPRLDSFYEENELHEGYLASATIGDGQHATVIFSEAKYCDGRYPYYCAFINGKAKRINGKSFKVNVQLLLTEFNSEGVYQ